VDNDSSNLTQVVLFEKYSPSASNYNLSGCYNLQATSSNHFKTLNVVINNDNDIEPDITFNPFDDNFYVTCYDSTGQHLPLLVNNLNMITPNSWNVISDGYNDSPNLLTPDPKVAINPVENESANFWIAERNNGHGMAMFDAQYSTYTGISEITGSLDNSIRVYPNPAKDKCQVSSVKCNIKSIEIFNLTGEKVYGAEFPGGTGDVVEINLDFPAGVYFVRVTNDKAVEVAKLVKQ
jgi:hypothetical protein